MTTPKSLESLEQQRVSITNQIAALGDLRCWIDHFHHWPMWQTQLPLPSAQGSRPRSQSPPDLQDQWQDGYRIPARPVRNAKGRTRNRRIPETASSAQGTDRGQRADLPTAPIANQIAFAAGKKTAEAIRQEVAREVDQFLRVIFQRSPQDGASGSGSHRDGGAFGHAPRWRHRSERTAAIPGPGRRTADHSLCLRPPGVITGSCAPSRF